MEKNIWLDLGYWAQKKAREAGADKSALGINQSRNVEVNYRDGKVEKLKESTQQSLWIDIYAKGRFSTHTTNDLRKESLDKFIRNAVDLTAYLQNDPNRKLADPKLYMGQPDTDLDLTDSNYEKLTAEERQERAKTLGGYIMDKDERLISVESSFSDNHREGYHLISNGFEGHRESTYFDHGIGVSMQGKGDRKPEGYRYYGARHLEDLVDAKQTAMEALKRTQDKMDQVKIKTATMPMLLENSNAGGFLSRVIRVLSGAAIQQKQSFLVDQRDQQVASDILTVTDIPTIVRGTGSRYYDGDGIAAKSMPIFDKGLLRNYYVDVYYGNKLGWAPTTGRSSNLIVKPGNRSGAEIEADLDRAILVTDWLGGNANGTTGDYSFGIAGWLIENGKRTTPISEMNIAGNFKDLLMNIMEIGNDPWVHSSFRTPTMLFDKVSFSGS